MISETIMRAQIHTLLYVKYCTCLQQKMNHYILWSLTPLKRTFSKFMLHSLTRVCTKYTHSHRHMHLHAFCPWFCAKWRCSKSAHFSSSVPECCRPGQVASSLVKRETVKAKLTSRNPIFFHLSPQCKQQPIQSTPSLKWASLTPGNSLKSFSVRQPEFQPIIVLD